MSKEEHDIEAANGGEIIHHENNPHVTSSDSSMPEHAPADKQEEGQHHHQAKSTDHDNADEEGGCYSNMTKDNLRNIILLLLVLLVGVVVAWIVMVAITTRERNSENVDESNGVDDDDLSNVVEWVNETVVMVDTRTRRGGWRIVHEIEMTPNGRFMAVTAAFQRDTPRVFERIIDETTNSSSWEALPPIPLPNPINVYNGFVKLVGGDYESTIPLTVAVSDPLAYICNDYMHVFEYVPLEGRWQMLGNGGLPFLIGETSSRGNAHRFALSRTVQYGIRLALSASRCVSKDGTEILGDGGVRMYSLSNNVRLGNWVRAMDDHCTSGRPEGVSLSNDGSTLAVLQNNLYRQGQVRLFRWIDAISDSQVTHDFLQQYGQYEIISVSNNFYKNNVELNGDGTRFAIRHGNNGHYKVFESRSVKRAWLPVGGDSPGAEIILPDRIRDTRIRLSEDGQTLVAGYTVVPDEDAVDANNATLKPYGEVRMLQFLPDQDEGNDEVTPPSSSWQTIVVIRPTGVNETLPRLVTDVAIPSATADQKEGILLSGIAVATIDPTNEEQYFDGDKLREAPVTISVFEE